jgi:hypothetical protein
MMTRSVIDRWYACSSERSGRSTAASAAPDPFGCGPAPGGAVGSVRESALGSPLPAGAASESDPGG